MDEPEKNSFPSPLGVAILLAAFAFGFSFYELRLWVGDFQGITLLWLLPASPPPSRDVTFLIVYHVAVGRL